MSSRHRAAAAAWVAGLTLAAAAIAEQRAIVLDGLFRDWRKVKLLEADPRGDGAPGGVDLRKLWAVHDGRHLYLRLQVGRETILQNGLSESAGSHLRLLLDLDGSPATGLPFAGLGVELEARLGEREQTEYDASGNPRVVSPGEGRVIALPTHSASAFELRVALPRSLRPDPRTGAGGTVRLVLADEQQAGDRLPDIGFVSYELSGAPAEPVEPIDFERADAGGLRLVSLNVSNTTIATEQARYARLLEALAPDILGFQEVRDWSAEETRAYVAGIFPERDWWVEAVEDCVTVSAYPIRGASAVDGNLLAYIDLPDAAGSRDLVLFNVHLPCCDNDAGRDLESDNLAAAWRDLLAGAGPFAIDPDDAMVLLGDFNFVGFKRQLNAVRRGIFIDPERGPNFRPGRKKGRLAVADARRTHAGTATTWRRAASRFAPGRLDYLLYTSDALRLRKSFSIDTKEMPNRFRRSHKLRFGDSLAISDHLPLVADFELRAGAAAGGDQRGAAP